MKRLALLLALAACAAPPPVATDFDADSVTIQNMAATPGPDVTAEAERLCAINGRKPTYLGSHRGPDISNVSYATGISVYATEHEYACVASAAG